MDAYYVSICILLLSCGLTIQMQETEEVVTTNTGYVVEPQQQNATEPPLPVTPAPVVNCTTGRGAPGQCVERQACDYGTPAIDSTLYAPRGYRKVCKETEACCPLKSIVVATAAPQQINNMQDDSTFDFDADD
ncbi:uncharacterized protein LOC113226096 [Hyposmocoma kahamanoa]|uniref:uncharacterized protein LOC113226096 n=1 Tax=Hyposmocoma kahamanoa TaxID=1477025 RepID=UPI000E6D8FF7|nr:uncharacterized protein LOC113226096 [Hyposmocoma kahamanoa]